MRFCRSLSTCALSLDNEMRCSPNCADILSEWNHALVDIEVAGGGDMRQFTRRVNPRWSMKSNLATTGRHIHEKYSEFHNDDDAVPMLPELRRIPDKGGAGSAVAVAPAIGNMFNVSLHGVHGWPLTAKKGLPTEAAEAAIAASCLSFSASFACKSAICLSRSAVDIARRDVLEH